MKIILLKDIKGQGKKDDIIEVKDGYGKFLVSKKDAVVYTNKSAQVLESEIIKRKKDEEELIQSCLDIKKRLEKLKLKFEVKTGSNDKVFGSISTKNISNELKKNGFDIDKRKISLDNEITSLGFHNVVIELHKKVKASIKVELIKK